MNDIGFLDHIWKEAPIAAIMLAGAIFFIRYVSQRDRRDKEEREGRMVTLQKIADSCHRSHHDDAKIMAEAMGKSDDIHRETKRIMLETMEALGSFKTSTEVLIRAVEKINGGSNR